MLIKLLISTLIIGISFCELLAVVNIFRYGSSYPNSKTQFEPKTWDSYNYGKLTGAGMREQYILGLEMRAKYIDSLKFLPPNFDPRTVYVATSYYDKTYDSAYAQIMGLYPPGTGPYLESQHQQDQAVPPLNVKYLEEIKKTLGMSALPERFQGQPIHHVDPIDDYSLSPLSNCHKIQEESLKYKDSQEYQDYVKENYDQTIRQQLSEAFGSNWDDMTFDKAIEIYEWIDIYKVQGWDQDIPQKITQDMIKQLQQLYNWYQIQVLCPTFEVAKLYASGMFNRIINFFEQTLANKTLTKMGIFSSHGSTLVGLIKALDLQQILTQNEFPTFASSLQVELHKDSLTGLNLINIFYQGKQVSINGCSNDCPYDQFMKKLRDTTLPDQIAACSNSKLYYEGLKLSDLSN